MDPAGLLGLVLLWLFGSKSSAAPAPAPAPNGRPGPWLPPGGTAPPPYVPYRPPLPGPQPWPQVVPPDLPKFPGPGWEYDEPPPPDVKARAAQLREQLWKLGQGSSKTEQTGGRWVSYQAQIVRSGAQGVVAYRLKRQALPAPTSSRTAPTSSPGYVPYRPPVPAAAAPVQVMPGAPPLIARPLPSIPPLLALPELRRGAGLPPKAPDPNVAHPAAEARHRCRRAVRARY